MTGYEEFQRIMKELNYKIHNQNKTSFTDNDTLQYLKDMFGI